MACRVTRFAPSPTGWLHLGHVYAALIAAQRSERFILRVEDIDRARCSLAFEEALLEDLAWLGLEWERPVLRQSARIPLYRAAQERLSDLGLTYYCTCTRGDIRAALSAPQASGTAAGLSAEPVYPGTCRTAGHRSGTLRLNMAAAFDAAGFGVSFEETGDVMRAGTHLLRRENVLRELGDIVVARRDIGTSYHIAVVVDDAAQGISEVTRGADLYAVTPVQVVLQRVLGLPTPLYHHHRLICNDQGRRLAKREDAMALRRYRALGMSPADVRLLVGL